MFLALYIICVYSYIIGNVKISNIHEIQTEFYREKEELRNFKYFSYQSSRRENVLDLPSIITTKDQSQSETRYLYRHIFQNINKYSSKYIIYPGSLFLSNNSEVSDVFISTEQESLESNNYFKHYETKNATSPSISKRGGIIETCLNGTGYQVSGNEELSYSADHVAFYETQISVEQNCISSLFKRGLNPNEASGKDSIITVIIKGLPNSLLEFEANVNLYEMKFDLSAPEQDFETTFFRETRRVNTIR